MRSTEIPARWGGEEFVIVFPATTLNDAITAMDRVRHRVSNTIRLALLVLPPQATIGLLLPMLLVGDAFSLGALWRRWDLREVGRLLPGMLIGVAAGNYMLARAESQLLARLLGALMLLFVAYWLLESSLARIVEYRSRRWHDYAAGGVAGVTSALAHSGGPPVAVYLLLQQVLPIPFVATTTFAFAIVNVVKIPAYFSAGLFDLGLQLQLAWALGLIPWGAGRPVRHRAHRPQAVPPGERVPAGLFRDLPAVRLIGEQARIRCDRDRCRPLWRSG